MDNFKFNVLSRGQLASLSPVKSFLSLFKTLPCYEIFFADFIFAIIARMFCENHFKLFANLQLINYLCAL